MTKQQLTGLSQDELVFDRMLAFHRQRVQDMLVDPAPLANRNGGVLLVHLLPEECIRTRIRLAGSELKAHGDQIPPLGELGGYSRFNVDGLLKSSGQESNRAYSQLFRDGRLETAMSDVTYSQHGASIMRGMLSEKAIFSVVSSYLKFCRGAGIKAPVWLFSALIECKGAQFIANRRFMDLSNSIDRSPAYLPEVEITSLEIKPEQFLRPLCDAFWQAGGVELSPNYDKDGIWHEQQ